MAVAMEVAWRGVELGTSSNNNNNNNSSNSSASAGVLDLSKKRAWGADTEKLMQLMMGQFGATTSPVKKPAEVTLDLLGTAAAADGSSPSSCRGSELDCNSSPEFLELDPDQPLPSGWEKCLDLKTGELYFVNKSTGVRTSEDPRKQLTPTLEVSTSCPLAHEFLGSKRSETLRAESLRTSSESSGGSPRDSKPAQLLSFSTGKQLWNLQLDDRSTVSLNKTGSPRAPFPNSSNDEEESNLELNLNLSPSSHHQQQLQQQQQQSQSVCTMEMVEKALKRTEKAMGKREMLGPKLSGSSSSLTSMRSEPSWSHSSPSTSSSSSTSSRSAAHGTSSAAHLDDSQALKSSTPGVCEAESRKADATTGDALVMGACTRCLTYVMLHKSDPKCPRCESEVPLDFISPPSSKRQRVETTSIQT